MKRIVYLFVALFLCSIVAQAQQYSSPPPQFPKGNTSGVNIDHFPEIPGITVDQRLEVGNIIVKEKKKISSLLQNKTELESSLTSAKFKEKKKEKNKKKITEIDSAIIETIDKSNNKVKEVLSEEQYKVFIAKRDEFIVSQAQLPTLESIQQQIQMTK